MALHAQVPQQRAKATAERCHGLGLEVGVLRGEHRDRTGLDQPRAWAETLEWGEVMN